jgi:V/A-type H+-transporting ATPase subunit I
VSIKFGKLANGEILPLENELKSRIGYFSLYVHGKKRIRFVALVSTSAFSEEIGKIAGKYGFQGISVPEDLSGNPSSCLRFLDSELNAILKESERRVLCLHDAVLAKIERLMVKEKLGQTRRIFVLEGWIHREKEEEVKTLINQAAEGHATVAISDANEAESEIPTLLRKRRLLGHFRMLTEMYGMPQYNEIDPTPFFAVFFAFFIGLMNADLAIGTTIVVSSLLIRRGAGSRSETMKSLSIILLCIGVSSIFFGVLMGEFMGRLVALPILWISAADNPIDFLLIVIGIGMVHLVFGTILGFLNSFFKREFRKIIGKHLSTFLLIGSGAFFLLTGRFEFEGVAIVGYLAGIAGLAALIIGNGLLGILDLTRLLSNVISYVRILALNMATTVMSRTFVLLGGLLVSVTLVGPILNGVLLLFSHFFIVFISLFATFAHSLRLHYVEFFGRFFIGGGTKFSPLTSERVYTTSKSQTVGQIEEGAG